MYTQLLFQLLRVCLANRFIDGRAKECDTLIRFNGFVSDDPWIVYDDESRWLCGVTGLCGRVMRTFYYI